MSLSRRQSLLCIMMALACSSIVIISMVAVIFTVAHASEGVVGTQQKHPFLDMNEGLRKQQGYYTNDNQQVIVLSTNPSPLEMTMTSTKTTTMTDVAGTLRSRLLHLLQTLPNNTTQREMSEATVRTAHDGKITLCTQGGVSKLDRLVDLVGRWLGPVSCAVYITTEEQLDTWLAFVAETTRHHHQLIATHVSFHILLEQPQLPLTVNRHPINKLRNLALRNAETDHVFLNDIDFMTPANAHDMLLRVPPDYNNNNDEQAHPASLPPPNVFWVLPAFERFGTTTKGPKSVVTNVSMIPDTKTALLQALHNTTTTTAKTAVAPFHEYFPAGHAPCNYTKWYAATTMYNITYDFLFEPYVICHKQGLPEYFDKFRGFAFNKMSFFMEAHYRGYTFQVHPRAFVVHMNHGGRKGRNDKGGDSKYVKEEFRNYLAKTYHVPRKELGKWK